MHLPKYEQTTQCTRGFVLKCHSQEIYVLSLPSEIQQILVQN